MNPWQLLLDVIQEGLTFLHGVFAPLFGAHAWGWAIIGLTVVIRVLLLPLAMKQTRNMRAMQTLAPKVKRIQAKYKADRELLKKDPQAYRDSRQKMNEEVMGLYREHNVNPMAGCLPLLLQAPIFFALFRVLNNAELQLNGDRIAAEPFYVFSPLGAAANSGVWGWVLILGMAATMFVTQRQMMGRTQMEGAQAQQQKIMLYVMPVFLAVIAQSLPIGVLLYWVTTNLWQLGQQAIIIREVQHEQSAEEVDVARKTNRPAGAGKNKPSSDRSKDRSKAARKGPAKQSKDRVKGAPSTAQARRSEHLPSRRGGSKDSRRRNA
ncbi:MAG: YidC/Oxa1 family membrane protein insertase [Actinomycetota bacterium]|nr:YidC/Oxa1 family membrane protein insertase [Actinomycetota bacterium]